MPELQPAVKTAEPELSIKFGHVDWSLPKPLKSWRHFNQREDSIYCYWNIVGKFRIQAGTEIIIELKKDVDESMIRLPLLGPVLALALHQRSHFILHASAVVINDTAALFTAASGQGKSTTAATLYGRGHRLMTDDVAALVLPEAGAPILQPGFPRVKLWPDAVTPAIQEDPKKLKTINQAVEKLTCATSENFCQEPVSVGRIYKLAAGDVDKPQIVLLPHKEAVTKLLENTYVPMLFGNEFSSMLSQSQRFWNVRQSTRLAKKVPVCRLERPYDLERLPELASLIERDLSSPVSETPAVV